MKRTILTALLVLSLGLLPCLVPTHAAQAASSREAVMVPLLTLKSDLLLLWGAGLLKSQHRSQAELTRAALAIAFPAEQATAGRSREFDEEPFADMPGEYRYFLPGETLQATARRLFGQVLTDIVAPKGTTLAMGGLFIDPVAFGATGDLPGGRSGKASLPGRACIDQMQQAKGGGWEIHGTLQRFSDVNGREIEWRRASFRAVFRKVDGEWRIREYEIREEGVG